MQAKEGIIMYDYRKQMLKEYHEKLEEYRDLLGTIPTDEKITLERVISNPLTENEMDFCINCLRFFNDSTKSFTNITEEIKQNNKSEQDIDRWLETVDGLLYHHRYTFETKKEYYQKLLEQRNDLVQKIKKHKISEKIYEEVGYTFNLNSPKQLGEALFEKLALPKGKKTKSGWSTNADILEKLAPDYPVVEKILLYRTWSKLKSTYCEGLIKAIGHDGRIHSTLNQTETRTGRIS